MKKVANTKKQDYFNLVLHYYSSLINNKYIQCLSPNFCNSHTLKCLTVSKVKGQWLPLSPTGPHRARRTSQLQTLLWVINTSARLSFCFLPHGGELGCTLLIFHYGPACFYTGVPENRGEEWKSGSKGREWIKEQEEKAIERARWAPSQSIYQTQCGPPLPSPLLSCPKPPCNSVMIFIII